ncbi:uncharacterized protein B4U80_14833, partial [Leptotrombidium deliense]
MEKAFEIYPRVGCSAHNLNLLDGTVIEDIGNQIKICKDLVTYFKRSGLQSQLTNTLKQSIEVRWDSTFEMIESITKSYSQLQDISTRKNEVKSFLDKLDETLLRKLQCILLPFKVLREKLCQEKEVTFNI